MCDFLLQVEKKAKKRKAKEIEEVQVQVGEAVEGEGESDFTSDDSSVDEVNDKTHPPYTVSPDLERKIRKEVLMKRKAAETRPEDTPSTSCEQAEKEPSKSSEPAKSAAAKQASSPSKRQKTHEAGNVPLAAEAETAAKGALAAAVPPNTGLNPEEEEATKRPENNSNRDEEEGPSGSENNLRPEADNGSADRDKQGEAPNDNVDQDQHPEVPQQETGDRRSESGDSDNPDDGENPNNNKTTADENNEMEVEEPAFLTTQVNYKNHEITCSNLKNPTLYLEFASAVQLMAPLLIEIIPPTSSFIIFGLPKSEDTGAHPHDTGALVLKSRNHRLYIKAYDMEKNILDRFEQTVKMVLELFVKKLEATSHFCIVCTNKTVQN